jgi:Domain of unknown function (DUF4386)
VGGLQFLGSGGDLRVELGALFEIITLIAGIGTAVALYPVLRRQSEGLALPAGCRPLRARPARLRAREYATGPGESAAPAGAEPAGA